MLPVTAGARPGKINMMSLPNSASSRLFPERKPSPTPTSSNKDPTPHAIPNIVRNERSLCAHRLRKICPKMSNNVRMGELLDTLQLRRTLVLEGYPFLQKDPSCLPESTCIGNLEFPEKPGRGEPIIQALVLFGWGICRNAKSLFKPGGSNAARYTLFCLQISDRKSVV